MNLKEDSIVNMIAVRLRKYATHTKIQVKLNANFTSVAN
jgi:hypothetical protein